MAEKRKCLHEKFKHSDQGVYPVQSIDNSSKPSNWVRSLGPDQIKEWQNEDHQLIINKPNK